MTYNLTFQKTTDGQSPAFTSRHPDGYRAVIESVSGTVANGETLTINGHFSAKRDGDLFSLISTPGNATSPITSYVHTTAESFLGSGASVVANVASEDVWAPGGNPILELGQHDQIYYSYLYKAVVSNWGDGSLGPQIKMERPMVKTSGHSGTISTIHFVGGDGATYSGSGYTQVGFPGLSAAGNDLGGASLTDAFSGWVRKWGYFCANEAGKRNGAKFICFKNETNKNVYFNFHSDGVNINNPRKVNGEDVTPFFTPKYFHEDADPANVVSGTEFWLPFFTNYELALALYIDGLIINDSPESVWLVNGTDVDSAMATGKAVQLPQLSRNTETIQAQCWLGDFTASDNVYLTTFNQDGKHATPQLVRSAT